MSSVEEFLFKVGGWAMVGAAAYAFLFVVSWFTGGEPPLVCH